MRTFLTPGGCLLDIDDQMCSGHVKTNTDRAAKTDKDQQLEGLFVNANQMAAFLCNATLRQPL